MACETSLVEFVHILFVLFASLRALKLLLRTIHGSFSNTVKHIYFLWNLWFCSHKSWTLAVFRTDLLLPRNIIDFAMQNQNSFSWNMYNFYVLLLFWRLASQHGVIMFHTASRVQKTKKEPVTFEIECIRTQLVVIILWCTLWCTGCKYILSECQPWHHHLAWCVCIVCVFVCMSLTGRQACQLAAPLSRMVSLWMVWQRICHMHTGARKLWYEL